MNSLAKLPLDRRARFSFVATIIVAAVSLTACGGGNSGNPSSSSNVSGRVLATPYASQQASNWCWAAAEQMVLATYGLVYDQSQIVLATYGSVVDSPETLDQVTSGLYAFSNGMLNAQITGPLSYSEVQNAINQNAPVLVLYASPYGGEGHFVVIYGYTSGGDLLIDDPIFGQFTVPYAQTFTYGSGGSALIWQYSVVS